MIEVYVGNCTAFRSNDAEIAKAILGALGDKQVKLLTGNDIVRTGADIALLIVERATPKMA